ncbi:1807_t:CDS:2, partial [Racocetra persica]
QNNKIQNKNSWLYTELDKKQYEELFYLLMDMNNKINKEFTNYLSAILDEFCVEKNQETNMINKIKQTCPNCNNKLPTIAKIIDKYKTINATEKST